MSRWRPGMAKAQGRRQGNCDDTIMSHCTLEGHRCATAPLHTVARLEYGGDIAGRPAASAGNRIHNALVIRPEDLVRVPRSRVVVSVAGVQARHEIRQVMARLGFVELHDFVCTA
jgi:hypothetical protein